MTQHTQGPWRIQGENKDTVTFDAFGSCAQLCGRNLQSNATLIAAAPDLLEALKNLKGWFDYAKEYGADAYPINESYLTQATTAIAKAEGR